MDSFIGKKHKILEIDIDGDIALEDYNGKYYFSPAWLKSVIAEGEDVNKF